MTKVYKPINEKYIRTNGIYHNRTLLSSYLDSMNTNITNNTTNINNITGLINSHIVCDHSGDYNFPAGNVYKVYTRFDMNHTNRSYGNVFTRSGQYIVAQKSCVALIGCSFNFDLYQTDVQICLQVNNTTVHTIDSGTMNGMSNTVPLLMIYNLNSGDKISATLSFSDSSSHLCRGSRSYFFATALYTS